MSLSVAFDKFLGRKSFKHKTVTEMQLEISAILKCITDSNTSTQQSLIVLYNCYKVPQPVMYRNSISHQQLSQKQQHNTMQRI